MPHSKDRVKGRDNVWFSNDLSDLLERNQAWAQARKSKLEYDWLKFRRLRNLCTVKIRNAKSAYFLSETSKNLNNPLKFWKMIKLLTEAKTDTEVPSCIVVDDKKIIDKNEILNSFNNHFIAAGSLYETLHNSVSGSPTACPVDHLLSAQLFNFKTVTVPEVRKALKDLDPKKSSGPDKLEPYFLKIAADLIATPVTYLINLSLATNQVPAIWKSANVLSLHKGGDPANINNYRPISKLSVLTKLMESVISMQLKDYLINNNILNEFQSGFRKQHSTITAVSKVVNDLVKILDNKQGCAALFIDLSKAFDTVDHKILLQRLTLIGLSEHAVGWFNSYLTGRTQRLQVDGLASASLNILKGVPQGSILGPLLFSIYINNLCNNTNNTNYHFYADDTVLYCSGSTLGQAITNLQSAFYILQHNLATLKLVLNSKN
uniref:Reverse transcriptase domain-containing protein n=1 Tax=Cyprinus carpio TaxID=7962 RepID=A0A8C1QAV6_CYPCA